MQSVIIETSIWIEYFRGSLKDVHRNIFRNLIDAELAVITDVIKYELLVGTKSASDLDRMKSFVSVVTCASLFPVDLNEFTKFAIHLRKKGLLGAFADTSIAYQAVKGKFPVLSLDSYFLKLGRAGIIDSL